MRPNLFLDPTTHDLAVVDGNLRLTGPIDEEVAQRIKCNLLTFKGEWWLDPELGVPYYQSILGKGVALGVVESLLRSQIFNTQGVESLDSFSVYLNNSARTLQVRFSVTTSAGTTVTEEVAL